jgi:hypothetical protein
MRMLVQLDIRPILPSIRVPTLVMHRRDNQVLTIDHGRYLAEHIEGAGFVELPGADYALDLGEVDSVVDEVEEFLTEARASVDTDRVLATVLFTDIVGSTERAAELGDQRWREVLDAHDRLAERQLARYRGTLWGTDRLRRPWVAPPEGGARRMAVVRSGRRMRSERSVPRSTFMRQARASTIGPGQARDGDAVGTSTAHQGLLGPTVLASGGERCRVRRDGLHAFSRCLHAEAKERCHRE